MDSATHSADGLLLYPSEKVQAAARARLLAVLPDSTTNLLKDKTTEETAAWIRENAARFTWIRERKAYVEP